MGGNLTLLRWFSLLQHLGLVGAAGPHSGSKGAIALPWLSRASAQDGRHASCSRFDRTAVAVAPQRFLRTTATPSFPESRRCVDIESRRLEYLSVRG